MYEALSERRPRPGPFRVVSEWCQKPSAKNRGLPPTAIIRLAYPENSRADERTRTAELLITRELLCLLGYVGLIEPEEGVCMIDGDCR